MKSITIGSAIELPCRDLPSGNNYTKYFDIAENYDHIKLSVYRELNINHFMQS